MSNNIYVQNKDKFIYEVVNTKPYSSTKPEFNSLYMWVDLKLVAGIDYINPDTSNVQGYLSANNFIETIQEDGFNWLFMEESLINCLKENGYTVIEKLPKMREIDFDYSTVDFSDEDDFNLDDIIEEMRANNFDDIICVDTEDNDYNIFEEDYFHVIGGVDLRLNK